jgi:hypothetical protein
VTADPARSATSAPWPPSTSPATGGLAKTHLQNVLSAMAINIGRLGAWFDLRAGSLRSSGQ